MLYLIATPIGNLSDISYRAVAVLQTCDYILCEDTRHSRYLLEHYGIHKKLHSYHQFNESKAEDEIINDLRLGLTLALISDAGTPLICDPGYRLIQRCLKEDLPYSALPGPCAALLALTLSGFNPDHFQFVGFLPKKETELKKMLAELLYYTGTSICYETPHRLQQTLKELSQSADQRLICVARELTKKFETLHRGTALELLEYFNKTPPRGEIVLLISGNKEATDFTHLSPEEHVAFLQKNYGLSLQEAIKMAAQLRGVRKKEIYNAVHQL
jgi:16S rRNA (cytidine1402-2'-O)-methyltransferase